MDAFPGKGDCALKLGKRNPDSLATGEELIPERAVIGLADGTDFGIQALTVLIGGVNFSLNPALGIEHQTMVVFGEWIVS